MSCNAAALPTTVNCASVNLAPVGVVAMVKSPLPFSDTGITRPDAPISMFSTGRHQPPTIAEIAGGAESFSVDSISAPL